MLKYSLAEQRNKEIQKRKYSYFNNENFSKDIEVDNTKYFFDEGIVDKLSQKNTSKKVVDEKLVKNKLHKKKRSSLSDLSEAFDNAKSIAYFLICFSDYKFKKCNLLT